MKVPETIIMPRLTDTELKGIVAKWFKREGEEVIEGEALFVVETAKAVEDIESPASGELAKILAPEGSEVSVSEVIGIIRKAGESEQELNDFIRKLDALGKVPNTEAKSMTMQVQEGRVNASPAARKLALEHGRDLAEIKGTGPSGLITKEDVLKTMKSETTVAGLTIAERIPLTGIRKTAAEQVARGYMNPQVTITTKADLSEFFEVYKELRSNLKKRRGLKLTVLHLLIKATALALRDYPILNSAVKNGEIIIFKEINIAIATSTDKGLQVPILHHADVKTLVEIASSVQNLSKMARTDRLTIEEVRGGTFTISNLGAFGVIMFTPILNFPQCAVLGVGQLTDEVAAIEGRIEVRKMLALSLTFDHRIVDGVPAAQFLRKLKETLEKPSILQLALETTR